MMLVVPFTDDQHGLTSQVGGKGANLIALTAAGFPVPPGCIVTADAYCEFVRSINTLDSQIASFDYSNPDRLRTQCAAVREVFKTTPLPLSVQSAIKDALAALPTSEAFAIRSSSTFEDLAAAAFAGQHDTYLNIRGIDSILGRVRDCFASLWEDRAVMYRHHHGFNHFHARMAVVIQRQIASEVAGVGFSIDPVTGHMDRAVIDSNFGLGESVVSGECEVDHFEIDNASGKLISQRIGHKTAQIIATSAGAEHREAPANLADTPSLNSEQVTQIWQLIRRIENHYGWPQDIEWGWHAGALYLFQSRPVTTIPPQWTRDESAERFPRPMSPLSWDFITVAFRGSLSHSLALMGYPPLKGDWFAMFDSYIYGNQNAVRLLGMSRPIKARSIPELVAALPEIRRRFAWVLDLPINWARDLDRYLLNIGRLKAVPRPATLQAAHHHVQDVLNVACDYFLPNIAISMTQSGLHRLLLGLITAVVGQERALALVDGLLAGCETKTAAINRELHDLAAIARGSPDLSASILSGSRAFLETRISEFPDFQSRFTRFLDDHGHRETDMDYMEPTWSDQPWTVLDSVALILRSGSTENPSDTMRSHRVRYAQTEMQFLSSLPQDLSFFFRELIRLTRTYTMLDDLEHYQTTRMNPIARCAALWLGEHLVQIGAFVEPIDVFFLNKIDVESIVADPSPANAIIIRGKSRQNKTAYFRAQSTSPKWSLADIVEESAPTAGALLGVPGSPGRATGPCFIVTGPEDFKNFPPKSILIARTTNPAWTSLFYAAAAVITESGGALSHGAVTAREMSLPAVMSVRNAMSLLKNGEFVTVDGAAGTVTRV